MISTFLNKHVVPRKTHPLYNDLFMLAIYEKIE